MRFTYICHVLITATYKHKRHYVLAPPPLTQVINTHETSSRQALDSCDISPHAPTSLVSNTRNFMKIILYIVSLQICRTGLNEMTNAYDHTVGLCAVRRTWDNPPPYEATVRL